MRSPIKLQHVDLRNTEVLDILYEYSDLVLSKDLQKLNKDIRGDHKDWESATSLEYLEETKQNKDHIGFPLVSKLTDYGILEDWSLEFAKEFEEFRFKLNDALVTKFNALQAIYPPGGYIGWHTNENCHGYNVLLTYGSGYFRYQDPETKEIVTIYDEPNKWTAKACYFGESEDTKFWHCAANPEGYRMTNSFVIPHEGLWQMMIEDLSDH